MQKVVEQQSNLRRLPHVQHNYCLKQVKVQQVLRQFDEQFAECQNNITSPCPHPHAAYMYNYKLHFIGHGHVLMLGKILKRKHN